MAKMKSDSHFASAKYLMLDLLKVYCNPGWLDQDPSCRDHDDTFSCAQEHLDASGRSEAELMECPRDDLPEDVHSLDVFPQVFQRKVGPFMRYFQ